MPGEWCLHLVAGQAAVLTTVDYVNSSPFFYSSNGGLKPLFSYYFNKKVYRPRTPLRKYSYHETRHSSRVHVCRNMRRQETGITCPGRPMHCSQKCAKIELISCPVCPDFFHSCKEHTRQRSLPWQKEKAHNKCISPRKTDRRLSFWEK